ncbi:MAG TPA: NTP transferase domain-containing protein [Candidatus Cloacimonadota bacterium]|nr:NTP transferase domain-containing protein [Candidatus Cloacimonadota bacterium]
MQQSPDSTPYKIIAVILASGKGNRFGMPKSEAIVDGITFSERIKRTLQDAGIKDIILADRMDTPDMISTLRQALTSYAHPYNACLIHPVDHPFVQADTIRRLCEIAAIHKASVIRPYYQGRSGHPIIIPQGLDLSSDDEGEGLRRIIAKAGIKHVEIMTNDPGVLRNINYLQDM